MYVQMQSCVNINIDFGEADGEPEPMVHAGARVSPLDDPEVCISHGRPKDVQLY